MPTTDAHNGDQMYYELHGRGPAVLLYNANPRPMDHPMRQQALDFTHTLIDGLADRYRVVVMDYPGTPKHRTLTPDNVTRDLLAIADAASVDHFAWWGYSWGGVIGQQLALRTDRLTALAMTGFPPVDGPYNDLLRCSRVMAESASDIDFLNRKEPDDIRVHLPQFVTYYEHLQDFDDRAAQQHITCPKMCFVGAEDAVMLGDEVVTHIGETVTRRQDELEALGWAVEVIPGKDHYGALTGEVVLPRLSAFLDRHLL